MAKRQNADSDDADSPYKKRQKVIGKPVSKHVATEIQSFQDLQALLAFRQDTGADQFRQNIKSFKVFLDSIAYGEDNEDRSLKRKILLEYLQFQPPPADNETSRYLADIIQSWSFSTQSNNEGLFAAIAAVLALLLKATSSHLEFREYGNNLCKTLLQQDQLKLFDRGLGASKTKEHVISPCLRLLTEIVLYDGGVAAQKLYAHRDITFKRLDVFLGMRKVFAQTDPEIQRRPSIRTNALRYLYANLRLQSRSTKSSILADGKTIRAVFYDIKEDSTFVILEVLTAFKKDVVEDLKLSPLVKSRLFNESTLRSIASLYQYHDHENDLDEIVNVQHEAHSLLLRVCSAPDQGILRSYHEAYPRDDPDRELEGSLFNLNRRSILHSLQKRQKVSNVPLVSFLQSLRPYADILQCDLVLAVFKAAPDLVADYFQNKAFPFEPKLTSTWAGYSMFLLSAIQLPIPHEHVSGKAPPHLYLMMESILPQPLTKKALTRCLNQSSDLISFFAVRILIAAFQKFAKLLELLASAIQAHDGESGGIWQQARSEITDEFRGRCPEMKHVIALFRNCSRDSALFREAIARLLAMYYKHLPQLALEEKLDITIALSDALKKTSSDMEELHGWLARLELYNLLEVALRSPDMRWWHKPADMLLSPFTAVIRLLIANPPADLDGRVKALMRSIIEDTSLWNPDTTRNSLNTLVSSLQNSSQGIPTDTLFEFLDNCILRCVRKPVKYYDDLSVIVSSIAPKVGAVKDCKIDMLLVTILDQWPFLVKSATDFVIKEATTWLACYLTLLMHSGSNTTVLSNFRDQFRGQIKDKESRAVLKKALSEPAAYGMRVLKEIDISGKGTNDGLINNFREEGANSSKKLLIPQLPVEDEDHPALRRWIQMDIPEAIKDGEIGRLILCLCSKYEDIRKQAIVSLRKFSGNLETSGYSEWQQTYLLIGEVIEAAKELISTSPFPYFAGVIAARSLLVLSEPLHVMYSKTNRFLNKSPRWAVGKLPSYWVDKILLNPPTEDEAHYDEVHWLIDVLWDGLRTSQDMETYRRCHILERLLSMSASSLPRTCENKLLDLLFRCTLVGGSTTLITRCGLLSWIQSRINSSRSRPSDHADLRNLARRAYETSDQERVNQWANESVSAILERL